MWSFSGFYYRGESYHSPNSEENVHENDILELFTRLGASEEQQNRIKATPFYEAPYEQVWNEMTLAKFGKIPNSDEYSSEDWPQMLGTWDAAYIFHTHPYGEPPLKRSSVREKEYKDFCPCQMNPENEFKKGPSTECPLYEGREDN